MKQKGQGEWNKENLKEETKSAHKHPSGSIGRELQLTALLWEKAVHPLHAMQTVTQGNA